MTDDPDPDRDGDASARREAAARAADAGREAAMAAFRTDHGVELKAHGMDRVTAADRESQRRVLDVLEARYPGETVVAEEEDAPSDVPGTGPAWVVDPIDGTNNFAAGGRIWCVSVAAVVDGEPVAAVTDCPALGDRYVADGTATRNGDPVTTSATDDPASATIAVVFGLDAADRPAYVRVNDAVLERFGDLRRLGAAQVVLAMVAAGELDGAVSSIRLSPWDCAGGAHLVRAAGGRVTDPHGDRWHHDSVGLVASNGDSDVHEALLWAARRGLEND
jgi:myo-inositol-1(or 4)-monophosphatase